MQHRIRDHIRSNVVGYIALFCFAMGGSAYALDGPLPGQNQVGSEDIINGEVRNGDLGADSVASGKIADRQVKNADLGLGASSSNTIADGGIQGIDVKNDTLTGTQIDESTLKPEIAIGNAGLGATGGMFSCDPNQWANLSPNVNNEVGFTRDPFGIVHLHGVATRCGTPASGDTIFTLPAGSRPEHLEHLGTVAADAFGAVIVDPSGNVTAVAGNFSREAGGWISLDGLTFRCGPAGQNGCP
jgi:hypothetical protein